MVIVTDGNPQVNVNGRDVLGTPAEFKRDIVCNERNLKDWRCYFKEKI